MAKWNPSPGPREKGGVYAEAEVPVNSSSRTRVALLPGEGRYNVYQATRPLYHTQQDVWCWEYNSGHSTRASKNKQRKPKKRTAREKMLFSSHCLNVNTKERAICQRTGSLKAVTWISFRSREERLYVNLTGRPAPPEIKLCWLHCGGIASRTHSPWPRYMLQGRHLPQIFVRTKVGGKSQRVHKEMFQSKLYIVI